MQQETNVVGQSTLDQHMKNITYLRSLYFLVHVTLAAALAFALTALLHFPGAVDSIAGHWVLGLCAIALTLVIILLSMCVDRFKDLPLNWVAYIFFTIVFSYAVAFVCFIDPTRLCLCALVSLNVIILAFYLYTLCSGNYIPVLDAFLLSFGPSLLCLMAFIIFTKYAIYLLVMVYLLASVYGFYLGYSIRTSVLLGLFDSEDDEPVSGAVRIWGHSCLVFGRFGELFGLSVHKAHVGTKCIH